MTFFRERQSRRTWHATCGVDGSHWIAHMKRDDNPAQMSFCPDCQQRGLTAPGVLNWRLTMDERRANQLPPLVRAEIERAMADPTRIMPHERQALERQGFVAAPADDVSIANPVPEEIEVLISGARHAVRRNLYPLAISLLEGAIRCVKLLQNHEQPSDQKDQQ